MAEHQYKTLTITPIGASQHAIRVTISNSPINLIDAALLSDIYGFLNSLRSSLDSPKVVVFSSSDKKIWLSHLDLHLISAQYPALDSQATIHLLDETIELLNTMPIIFIAEVNGLAVGGGNELAVNMDMRFAGPEARFGIPEVAGGVVHGGGLQRLIALIGPARAMEWGVSARGIDSKNAARVGWVNDSFDSEQQLRKYVDDLTERVAKFPRGGIEATKKGIGESLNGVGSRRKDMERLVGLAHKEEAQRAISGFIERGEDQTRSTFELELPDSCAEVWGTSGL